MEFISWREVFDPQKFKRFHAENFIETINYYVYTETNYKYFILNGIVYRSGTGYYEITHLIVE